MPFIDPSTREILIKLESRSIAKAVRAEFKDRIKAARTKIERRALKQEMQAEISRRVKALRGPVDNASAQTIW